MALAITDDHGAQEAAFYDSPQWQRSPQALREHLTAREIDATRDPLARFVGIDVYEAAGGGVRRDLFSDHMQGAYLTDAALLDTLARDKLAAIANSVRAERWGWVEAAPRIANADLHGFQRAPRERRTPTKSEAKHIAKLEARQQAIEDRLHADDAEDIAEEEAQALYEESDRLGADLDVIARSLVVFAPETLSMAGAIVTIDHAGEIVAHRGLLREAEAQALRKQERQDVGIGGSMKDEPSQPAVHMSEKLARRLSAHRTAALQGEVARHPRVALVAVVHRLALRVVCDAYGSGGSPIEISASPQDKLDTHAPDVAQSPALIGIREVQQAWAARLPADPDALFGELVVWPQAELLSLLAVCVAATVSAVTPREDDRRAAALAEAVGLDMRLWWTPTAEGYFTHVSKVKVIEAVQVFAPDHATRLSKLKKAELTSEAERLAVDSGWLPAMLSAPVPVVPAETRAEADMAA
ncbi:MAG: hypothetical protein ACR2GP_14010 [Burkholderiaceae bacterium]